MNRPALVRLALPLLVAVVLVACGQKGALFLPDKGTTPVTATPPAAATPADEPDRSNEPRKRIH